MVHLSAAKGQNYMSYRQRFYTARIKSSVNRICLIRMLNIYIQNPFCDSNSERKEEPFLKKPLDYNH